MQEVWSAEDTTPAAIDDALRELLASQRPDGHTAAPARFLNLVVVVDREFSGEVENRLDRVGRNHPSRTILCEVERHRRTIDAWAALSSDDVGDAGIEVFQERVALIVGEQHLERLATVVDPLLVGDLQTLVWSPHGHPEAEDALLPLADVVLVDSIQHPDAVSAINRAEELLEAAYVVDLAWIRSMPWRERVAASFDPARWRGALNEISAVTVRHHPDSEVSGALLLGWLCSRLHWEPVRLEPEDGGLVGRARSTGRRVKLRLEVDETMPVPGLAGFTIEAASGLRLSLDRGSGGLAAKRKLPRGGEQSWVVLGASRGEAGILGEGIRQALLREPTYGPALAAASKLLT